MSQHAGKRGARGGWGGARGRDASSAYDAYDFENDSYLGKFPGNGSMSVALRSGETMVF